MSDLLGDDGVESYQEQGYMQGVGLIGQEERQEMDIRKIITFRHHPVIIYCFDESRQPVRTHPQGGDLLPATIGVKTTSEE